MNFTFIANDLVVKNNSTLKNQEQGAVELKFERIPFFAQVIGLEAYPPGTHFNVTITPITPTAEEGLLLPH